MWKEFQQSGIFDDVVRWQSLSSFLDTLTFISVCWSFAFPDQLRPAAPDLKVHSVLHLARLDLILESLILVLVPLQVPISVFAHTCNENDSRF